MAASRKYPEELRKRAIRLTLDARKDTRPPLLLIVDNIEQNKNWYGVERICATLTSADVPIAPSTFYAARTRPRRPGPCGTQDLKPIIAKVHKDNYGAYGIDPAPGLTASTARDQNPRPHTVTPDPGRRSGMPTPSSQQRQDHLLRRRGSY